MISRLNGYITAIIIGALWCMTITTSVSIIFSFATGLAFYPKIWQIFFWGAFFGLGIVRINTHRVGPWRAFLIGAGFFGSATFFWMSPLGFGPETDNGLRVMALMMAGGFCGLGLFMMLKDYRPWMLSRYEWEAAILRFLTGFGYIFFTAIVLIPFYVMVMTSLKSQQELLLNPLDFSIDFNKGWGLLRSYQELFTDFHFGMYLRNSFLVSVLTVLITLLFAVPASYAVARLEFRGRALLSRGILLIYMVPMIVLALPIYIAFSITGLRNTLVGIVMIYPVTTIPVAIYMLQGYFRSLPSEIEEAALIDGLSRLRVIWKITLPLSLPALASVSLYVFMIAWNEFLLAFMLLDDPAKFTLTRGVAMLNSSEIPRQHLMAGSVIATVPIMVLFLGLEKFMTKGLTAGSVKG